MTLLYTDPNAQNVMRVASMLAIVSAILTPALARHTSERAPADGAIPAGATVVLVPQEKERIDQMSYYKTVTTDQYGRFTVKSIDPGEYKVFAWEDVESGAYMDPDVVKPVENQGASVTIRESSRESLELKLIPAEAASASEKARQVQNN
jgi:Polysaccharide lyase family 4, domain II